MQRAFNLISAAAGLIVLAPLLAVIALAIKLGDGGPVFYSQRRVGRNFRNFLLHKFRSMAVDRADPVSLTMAGDPRVTRVGRFLRRHKLDELPQLLNILKGDMQLVGPRPEVERYVNVFRAEYAELLRDRPGVTDPASIAFRHEDRLLGSGDLERLYLSCILPRKLRLSLEYSRQRTFWSDLAIIFRTIFGADGAPEVAQTTVRVADES